MQDKVACLANLSVIITLWWLLVGALRGAWIISSRVCKPQAVHAVIQHSVRSISQSMPAPTTAPIPSTATPSAPTSASLILMPQALRGLHVSLCDSGRVQNGAGQDPWNVLLLRYRVSADHKAQFILR